MDLRELVKDWLVERGYTGLYCAGMDCGCELEDLMPCAEPTVGCAPGRKKLCDSCGMPLDECDVREEHGDSVTWCISEVGEEKKPQAAGRVSIVITAKELQEIKKVLSFGAHHESFPEILTRIVAAADAKEATK